jgi:uncharacterized membrane protein YkvA (DUF1232 family)
VSRWQAIAGRVKRELSFYRSVLAHPDTPWLSRILLGVALAYFVSPIDLLPDVIPVIGQLDDLVIVPGLIYLAFRIVPAAVIESCRAQTGAGIDSPSQRG